MHAMKVGVAAATLAIAGALPVRAQFLQRVSIGNSGVQGNGHSYELAISADGRFVAFRSFATNLSGSDTNGATDVFVRDRQAGTTDRVSVSSAQAPGNDHSAWPAISDDGRYVAFSSDASNLVAGDTNGKTDVFVRDRFLLTTVRVSVDSGGAEGDESSFGPSISIDGRYVAFSSDATNLVAGDTNLSRDVFVHDLQTGITECASVTSGGGIGDGESAAGAISADGAFVVFRSAATNLVPGDTNGVTDTFVRERVSGTTDRVSVDSGGGQGDDESLYEASITADGRHVLFNSRATNLVVGDTNLQIDVFLRDRQAGTTERISVDSGGTEGTGESNALARALSADGRYVAFTSGADNLVPGDTNNRTDVFLRDRQAGTTVRVSLTTYGAQAAADSGGAALSDDGRFVAFQSDATNLVPGDTNARTDDFLLDRSGGPAFASLCDPGSGGVIPCPCANAPGGPGQGCDNSSGTGGASLAASGGSFLTSDTLVFTTSGQRPTALSILLQGTTAPPAGIIYGQGVRCVGGSMKRLFTRNAVAGSVVVPDFAGGDPAVSARSAEKGDVIGGGQSRWYLVYYRDPFVSGGCPPTSTFNATQTGRIDWSF